MKNKKIICEIKGCGTDITNHGYEYKNQKICEDCFVELTSKPWTWSFKKWLIGDKKLLAAFFSLKVQALLWLILFIIAMIIAG
jgi:hypothetical protein